MSTLAAVDRAELARWQRGAVLAAAVAWVLCILGALFSPTQFLRAYLPAYLFFLGLGLGGMVILMIYHLTGGAWGFLVRRILEAQMRTLPLLAVLFLPIAFGIGYLYVWAQPDAVAADPGLQHQQFYLNPTYFWARAAAYFLFWLALAYFLSSWSREEDQTGSRRAAWKSLNLSGPGLVIYGASLHFAAIDWSMSVEPSFRSTIWGPLTASQQVLSAHAFVILVFTWLSVRPPIARAFSFKALNDLGSLLFTFLVLWAYMVWFQYMLIWMGNLPEEGAWYLVRRQGGWQALVWALFLFNFAVPFFLLLFRAVKQNPRVLGAVAGLVLFMQLAFSYYQVTPSFRADSLLQHWMDLLTPIAIGGLWGAYFLWQLTRFPLLALHDTNQAKALHLRELDEEEAAREEAIAHG